MDFLDQTYFNNPLRSYLIVLGTILAVVILRRFVSKHLASLLHLLVRQQWKNVSRAEFISLIVRPLGWFITCSIAIVAIDKLNYPEELDWKIYGHSVQSVLDKTGVAIIVVGFTWVLLGFVNFIGLVFERKALLTEEKSDEQLVAFVRDFLKVLIVILGALLIFKAVFNQDVGAILTSLSIVGAALALAAKESLENLIASFIIFFNKPFFTGDVLKVNNVTGTVENIGLRSTRIRTADKTLITVPNKLMVDSVVDNWSMRTHRRAEIKLFVSVHTKTAVLQELLQQVQRQLASGNYQQASAFFSDIQPQGYVLTVDVITDPMPIESFQQLKQELNFQLRQLMENNGIELAAQTAASA